jgi:putative phosphoesterase
MKIAVISDIHDNLPNLEKTLLWSKDNQAEKIICCGDVTNSETLAILSQQFSGQIYLVQGNCEIYKEEEIEEYKNVINLEKYGCFVLANDIQVGVCHEPEYIAKAMSLMPRKQTEKIIFYGHTHQPWEETRNSVRILNPGTVAGTFSKPTFAFWDTNTKKIDLIRIELI